MSYSAQVIEDVLALGGGCTVFQNNGLIDPMAITTFGLSAKECDNPIGMFGTGLKYAIAVLLRNGCGITIWRGTEKLEFDAVPHESRGKVFQIVRMNGHPLSFMTDLGPKWELWMAFRELFCNSVLDESGRCFWTDEFEPVEDETCIVVTGETFREVYDGRAQYVLDSAPLFVTDNIEVHDGASKTVFYRGIAVKTERQEALYTYNILRELDLTEDRTLKYDFQVEKVVAEAIQQTNHAEYVERCLTCGDGYWEHRLDFKDSYNKVDPSPTFVAVVRDRVSTRRKDVQVNESAIEHANDQIKIAAVYIEIELNAAQRVMWTRLEMLLTGLGYPPGDFSFTFWDSLGVGTYATDGNNKREIRVSSDAFEAGARRLAESVVTEIIRILRRDDDEADFVAREIIRIGERLLLGEAV